VSASSLVEQRRLTGNRWPPLIQIVGCNLGSLFETAVSLQAMQPSANEVIG
jgi:hypothetical protein